MKQYFSKKNLFLTTLLLLLGIFLTPDQTSAASGCTPGNQVNRAFWGDVVNRLHDDEVGTEHPVNDFAFAIEALEAWKPYENTTACWNPLATTWDTQDGKSKPFNYAGVKNYIEQYAGVRATAATISTLNTSNRDLSAIRQMLARQAFDEAKITKALNGWTNDGAYVSSLVRDWKNLYYNWSATRIVSRHSGKCLDVKNWSKNNGTLMQQWNCYGGNNQQWHLKNVGNEYYQIISLNSGKCLDVRGWSKNNGTSIQQWDCYGGNNQQWRLKKMGGNYYQIISRHTGKCLDLSGWSKNNGISIQQWDCHGGNNQQWGLTVR